MPRSLKKGPFVDLHLTKKVTAASAKSDRKPRSTNNLTTRRLGYAPMSFDDGLRLLISWLRGLGKL